MFILSMLMYNLFKERNDRLSKFINSTFCGYSNLNNMIQTKCYNTKELRRLTIKACSRNVLRIHIFHFSFMVILTSIEKCPGITRIFNESIGGSYKMMGDILLVAINRCLIVGNMMFKNVEVAYEVSFCTTTTFNPRFMKVTGNMLLLMRLIFWKKFNYYLENAKQFDNFCNG
ncbi:hypothetical protein HHI36_001024 [Cryptolaemus montrouzieri]|uniref:Uncharacterized protein n=1 Tax=Cryptolaemus montrouzieri TaxID=559131 RepID=A0ABD2P668_9CUCU